jgi:nitrogen fixation protein NifU and related proteins
MYSAEVLEHFQNPRGVGELDNATASVEVQNPVCGDVLRLSLSIAEGKIALARFRAKGCVPAIACGSKLVELLEGTSLDEARRFNRGDLAESLGGLPPASEHAAALAIDALQAALKKCAVSARTMSPR